VAAEDPRSLLGALVAVVVGVVADEDAGAARDDRRPIRVLNARAPAGSTSTAAAPPTRSYSRAPSVSPSAMNQSSESRRPTTSGCKNVLGSSA
jgi:hypothetical protein